MVLHPILPIWIMGIICAVMLVLKRPGVFPFIRQIIIVALLFVINLRPMIPGQVEQAEDTELNLKVLFVIDNTISMAANDYEGQTRLDAVKEDCNYIMEELWGAEFAVLQFDNNAQMLTPFSKNEGHVQSLVNSMHPLDSFYGRGTSLNTPYDLMHDVLKRAREYNDDKIVVFFMTDGENNTDDELNSFKGLRDYIDAGAVIGYGTDRGGTMTVIDFYGDEEMVMNYVDYPFGPAVSKIDEGNCNKLARDMQISYVHREQQTNLKSTLRNIKDGSSFTVVETIEGADEDDIATSQDVYYYFAYALLGMLAFEGILLLRKK